MKIVKWVAAALLGLSVQGALAGQIKGTLLFVSSVPGDLGGGYSDVMSFSVNPASAGFMDWGFDEHTPGSGYEEECLVPYVGWPVLVPMTTDHTGKQAMALLASANATGQEVMVFYHVNLDGDCELDGVSVYAAGVSI